MEFTLENEHIQLKIKDEKSLRDNSVLLTDGSLFHKISAISAEGKSNQWVISQIENQSSFTSAFVQCEVILRLDDYYLINNIKLFISEENDSEITINKIKFQNVSTRLWEWSYFFDPDNKDIISRSSDSISIFSVGLTDYIKLQFYMKFDEEFEGDTTTNSTNELLAMKKIKNILNKVVIYSQYIYSIPNATFLMTLLNLTNFFQNYGTIHQCELNAQDNYLCSLYLTASSMIQARLFIQALELLKNLQLFIKNSVNTGMKNNNFLSVVFEVNVNQQRKLLPHSGSKKETQSLSQSSANSNAIEASIYISMAKIELIKAVSMLEHGHWHVFLSFLRNCINIYYNNDVSCISSTFSLTKINEIASDKYHIQHFLIQYGLQLTDILLSFLKDKNELISYSVLKVIEFVIDYNPELILPSISKIIKHLFKLSYYPLKPSESTATAQLVSIPLYKRLREEKVYCPCDLFTSWLTYCNNQSEGSQKQKSIPPINQQSPQKNSLSQVLQKQINYTLDTIITNIDNFSSAVVFTITQRTHVMVFDIIAHSDKDSLVYLNAIKLLRKCFLNDNSSLLKLKAEKQALVNCSNCTGLPYSSVLAAEFLFNLFLLGIKPNVKLIFKDYLQIQSSATSLNKLKSLKTSKEKELKDMVHSANVKSNLIASLLNTNSLIESNEAGGLLMLIFDKVSDQCINCIESNSSAELLAYISKQLALAFEQLNKEDEYLELTLFYIFLLLQFAYILLFPLQKNAIKRELYSLPMQKHILFNSSFILELDTFISLLFKVETFTLAHKPSFVLFEVILALLCSIDDSFGAVIDFNFEAFFKEQYASLNQFIQSNGIFNENITFLLKTLPLCSLTDPQLVSSLKAIYSVILINFTNYYNEDSFQLFTLILSKLDSAELIDEGLFKAITKAIVSKANYKGNSVKQCYNKFFEIIFCNMKKKGVGCYYAVKVKLIIEVFNQFREKLRRNEDKVRFKEFYLEMIEMIDLLKGFFEYARSALLRQSNEMRENVDIIKEMMIFSNDQFNEALIHLMKGDCMDETVISKINGLFEANHQLVESNEDNEECHRLLLCQAEKGVEYYRLVNRTNNCALLAENCKGIAQIVQILNKFTAPLYIERKLKLFIDLFNTVNLHLIKEIQLKNLKEELMSFFEELVIPIIPLGLASSEGNDTSTETRQIEREYYAFILKAVTFQLESSDELMSFFGIEILLKVFGIKMEDGLDVSSFKAVLQLHKQSLKWLNSIIEKLIKLILHSNYKISLFAIYIIQLLTIDRESIEPVLQLKLTNTTHNPGHDRDIKAKLKLKSQLATSSSKDGSFYWMTDQEITQLHNFIRDKIIFDYKPKSTEKNDNASLPPIEEDNASSFDKGIKVDEVSDDLDDEFNDVEEASIIPKQMLMQRPNEAGSQINQIGNSSKDDEDNLTLEELGVVEVDDEIFDNFDEENIPILKSNCIRTKGFAAKVKTNQNSRSLLMSEHVQMQNGPLPGYQQERYRNANEEIPSGINQSNANEEFGDVPDLTTKKKNIRPLNGLRPATPPLRNNNSNTSTGNNVNSHSTASLALSNPINPTKSLPNNATASTGVVPNPTALNSKTIPSPNSLNLNEQPKTIDNNPLNATSDLLNDLNRESSNRLNRNSNRKKMNRCRSEDKLDSKYEVQSMEELFIDEGQMELDINLINRNNTGKESQSSSINQKWKYQSKFQKPSLNMNLIAFPSSSSTINSVGKNQRNFIQNKKELAINVAMHENNAVKPDLMLLLNERERERPKHQEGEDDHTDKANDREKKKAIEQDEVVMCNQQLNFNVNEPISSLNVQSSPHQDEEEEHFTNSIEADRYLEEELDEVLYEDTPMQNKPNSNRPPAKNELKHVLVNINPPSNFPNNDYDNQCHLNNTSFGTPNPNQLSVLSNSNSKYLGMNTTFTFSNNPLNSPGSLQNSRNLSLNNINQEKQLNQNMISSSRKAIKNIHHLHNIQKKSSSSQNDLNLLQTIADLKKNNYVAKEDFRSVIKKTINQNSNKIINNLKKFKKSSGNVSGNASASDNSEKKKTINDNEISEKSSSALKAKTNSNSFSPNDVAEPKISGMNTPNFNHYNSNNSTKP